MYLFKKSVEDVDVKDKRVLIRVDLDVPLGKAQADEIIAERRIATVVPTIKSILERGAKSVVLMSHLGCPDGLPNVRFSLAPVSKRLEKLLGSPVKFLKDCACDMAEEALAEPDHGSVILLENLRFHAEEEGQGIAHGEGCPGRPTCGEACLPLQLRREDVELFRGRLDALGDVYVNDAFSVTHLAHSSVIGVDLPDMVAGPLLMQELAAFSQIVSETVRPFVAIVAGEDLGGKLALLERLAERADTLIICGGTSAPFLMETGKHSSDEGRTRIQVILDKAREAGCEIILPVDLVCGRLSDNRLETQLCSAKGIPDGWKGLDCGPDSIEQFAATIFRAKAVFWTGAVGKLDIEHLSKGTKMLMDAVAALHERGGYALIHGDDLAAAAIKWNLDDKVSFISSGGQASFEHLQGKRLPGLAVLADKDRALTFEGTAAGKYSWGNAPESRSADEDMMSTDKISKFSWSDGRKRVSIYIELEGADNMTENAFKVCSGKTDVSLTIEPSQGKRRIFSLAGLCHEITGAKIVQKKGKNIISLQLQKQEEKSWPQLIEKTVVVGSDDDN